MRKPSDSQIGANWKAAPSSSSAKSSTVPVEAWRPEEGWAASYHLFDEPTGTLVVEGARTAARMAARAQP